MASCQGTKWYELDALSPHLASAAPGVTCDLLISFCAACSRLHLQGTLS